MKTAICFALALAGIAVGQTKPNDVDGWGKIKWGMTAADAKAALGDQAAESTEKANPYARLTESLVIGKLMVGDIPCRGTIYSKKGSDAVVSVTIRAGQAQDPAFLRGVSYDSLKSLLIEKYGPPKSDDRRVEG